LQSINSGRERVGMQISRTRFVMTLSITKESLESRYILWRKRGDDQCVCHCLSHPLITNTHPEFSPCSALCYLREAFLQGCLPMNIFHYKYRSSVPYQCPHELSYNVLCILRSYQHSSACFYQSACPRYRLISSVDSLVVYILTRPIMS
jgi:hypothetical protein